MARPLQILYRIWSSSVASSFSVHGVRFASRGANRAWMGQSHDHRARASRYSDQMPDDQFGLEDVEDKLQTVVDEERKRQKTVKYHILRRQMTPSGAPQRKLTWDAIEQIRYLKQEQPEEWTVEHLAEGFSVSPDVILRVLRSKFVPSPERKAKQDIKVMAGLSQQVLPSGAGTGSDQLKLPGNCAQAVLPSGREDAVVPVADRTLMLQYGSTDANSLVSSSVLPTEVRAGINRDTTVTTSETNSVQEDEEEEEEGWDGTVFTEEELEQYIHMENPSPAVQVGNDFFDTEGNFLYRI
ncbi:neugrin [Cheilinus undulatus]|uniref:neugrin n=1 Tax=Cheilinus undulatus TaxID=241271 RepID=UPI001BD3E630|nr:neugrin [Cheilinus undulatus]